MRPSDLEQSIVRTITLFSVFSYPVTGFEIWKWLIEPNAPYRLQDVLHALQKSEWIKARIETGEGFFVLKGELYLVETRHSRFLDAQRKFKRLKWVARYLSLIPTICSVATCNTLSWANSTKDSDIDVFVITKENRLWITRLLSVLPFALLKIRPHMGKSDPVDFSFFLSKSTFDLKPHRIHKKDLYLAQWIKTLVPIFGEIHIRELQMGNKWGNRIFPMSYEARPAWPRRQKKIRFNFPIGLLEVPAEKLQRKILPVKLKELANTSTHVVISGDMLKFHTNDRRRQFFEKWYTRCRQLECLS